MEHLIACQQPHGRTLLRSTIVLAALLAMGVPSPLTPGGVLATPVSSVAQATPNPQPAVSTDRKLLGQWLAQSPVGSTLPIFIFAPNGKLFIVAGQSPETGKARYYEFQYRIKSETQPMQVDIVLSRQETLQTVFDFTPTDELRIQLTDTQPGQARPTAISDTATLFQRISNDTTPPPGTEPVAIPAPSPAPPPGGHR